MLFRLIAGGFVLLSLTVLTGVVFGEEVFGQALALGPQDRLQPDRLGPVRHAAAGPRLRGWRGPHALRFTLGGFALLLMAYVGSRFVLEVLLERAA
jgi:ABC-type uncharacterized transport system permease subunit